MTARPIGPSLDRSGEPWLAEFPTLGLVCVYEDGSVEVVLEPDLGGHAEGAERRETALRYGWGEPLSLVRQGYQCAWGSGLVPPDGHGCLIMRGPVHDVAIVLVELVGLGWSVLSDRFVPITRNEGALLAHPRTAPVLISRSRADRAGLGSVEVRARTDAVAVDVPRASVPQPVQAVVEVVARRPDQAAFEELTGHERFVAASQVMAGGVLAGGDETAAETSPQEMMRQHLELAALSFGRLRIDSATVGADVAECCRWWTELASSDAEAAR